MQEKKMKKEKAYGKQKIRNTVVVPQRDRNRCGSAMVWVWLSPKSLCVGVLLLSVAMLSDGSQWEGFKSLGAHHWKGLKSFHGITGLSKARCC
jgi:hypothetical protein